MIRTITFLLFLVTIVSLKAKAQLPNGFADQVYSSGWNNPTGLTFDAAGKMYVWEKDGKVYVVENNVKTLFLDISEEVANYGDYGILGFVLDPNFLDNGHVYLYYIVDRYYLLMYGTQDYNPETTWEGATIGRVTRYTTPTPLVPNVVNYGSRTVLIGETISTGFPITGTNHGGGGMVFGSDGSLFVGCGDGGLGVDYSEDALNNGIISEAENVQDRVYRCQMVNSLNGKIVRIDPSTGNGLSSNPYFDANSPRAAQSRVWALGFRNPFRISLKPNSGSPGVIYVGEVGWNTREELNIITNGGQNFGWPIYEGIDLITPWTEPAYTPASYKKPTVEWTHHDDNSNQPDAPAKVIINGMVNEIGSNEFPGSSFIGFCSIGGVWYTGTVYPEEFRDSYIFADFISGWIKSFAFDNNENPTSFRELHSSAAGAVTLAYNPVDESIYYLKLGFNEGDPLEVHKITYGTVNLPPVAKFTYNPSYGASPLSVSFDASPSTDYENSALTYTWNFGDGSTGTGVNISHTFDNGSSTPQKFDVTLTVTDEGELSSTTTSTVSLNNTPPIINSTSVSETTIFANNNSDLVQLSAQVSDNEEPSEQLTYRWVVRLHHDEHSHPELDVTRMTSQVNLPQVPCDGHLYFYRVTLTVSDSYGLSTTFTKDIYPNCTSADAIPPEIPLIKSYDNTDTSFKLSWNNVADNVGVTTYEVFVNGASQGLLNSQILSYQYTSATSVVNQSFDCYVKVKDLAGNENKSSNLIFKQTSSSTGGEAEFLSNLTPVSSTNGFGPIEIDQSNGQDAVNDGLALTLNGVVYSKGLGVHAGSEIIYDLTPNVYNTFSAKIGIDDEIPNGTCGSVVFKVFKDNVLVYTSPTMRASSATIPVEIGLANASQLKLVADIAGDNFYCDHADWADAKLFNVISNPDVTPPSNPTNLDFVQLANYFQISWNASTDDTDASLEYEILIDNVVYATTSSLQSPLPVLPLGNHVISIQAKDDAKNRAVSKTITLTYGACQSSMTLASPSDNFSNNAITLKTSNEIKATNIIAGTSKVTYQSANKIELLPGFKVDAGSIFTAKINGCSN